MSPDALTAGRFPPSVQSGNAHLRAARSAGRTRRAWYPSPSARRLRLASAGLRWERGRRPVGLGSHRASGAERQRGGVAPRAASPGPFRHVVVVERRLMVGNRLPTVLKAAALRLWWPLARSGGSPPRAARRRSPACPDGDRALR